MKIYKLTEKQLEIIACENPGWVADNCSEYMIINHLDYMIKYRPEYMANNYPEKMVINNPVYMADNYPEQMAKYRPKWMLKHRPQWMEDNANFLANPNEVPDFILKILEDK